jgi:hypothetical protein
MRFSAVIAPALATISIVSVNAFWRAECRSSSGIARIDPIVTPGNVSDHLHIVHGSSGTSSAHVSLLSITPVADEVNTSSAVDKDNIPSVVDVVHIILSLNDLLKDLAWCFAFHYLLLTSYHDRVF